MTRTTLVIAEAGVNHNGDLGRALAMVAEAKAAGADAVKFQSFKTQHLVAASAPKADYQKRTTGAGSQQDMLKALELSEEGQRAVLTACAAEGIEFMSTPFDMESARFLIDTLDVARLKVASGEATNAPLLLELARSGKPVILSTGMCTLDDVRASLGVLAFGYTQKGTPSADAFAAAFSSPQGQAALRAKVTVLHCTSEYPAAIDTINLRAMDTLARTFGLPVGLSDHSPGITVAIAAVARGATVIEKHFTLDKALPGPDHKASLTVAELKDMVAAIRDVESALGAEAKQPSGVEIANRTPARKSLVAIAPIAAGEAFSAQNLGVKRPGNGVSPYAYWSYIGKPAARGYRADELIEPQ